MAESDAAAGWAEAAVEKASLALDKRDLFRGFRVFKGFRV